MSILKKAVKWYEIGIIYSENIKNFNYMENNNIFVDVNICKLVQCVSFHSIYSVSETKKY